MTYTLEELKLIRRKFMYAALIEQIKKNDFSTLSKMWEMLKIDNSELVRIAHTLRNIPPVLPHNMIFWDMAWLIYEKSEEKEDILRYFYERVKFLKPQKVREAEEFVKILNKKGKVDAVKYLNQTHWGGADYLYEYEYFVYAYVADTNLHERMKKILDEFLEDVDFAYFGNDTMYSKDEYYTFNNDEKIFDSELYAKYLRKRKEELIEFLCIEYQEEVTKDNLYDFIAAKQKSQANVKEMLTYEPYIESSATWGTAKTILEQNGGLNWYSQITNDGSTGFINALAYRPNIERIVENYYKYYLQQKCRKYEKDNKERIYKIYLSRECVPSPREAYIGISYLYNIDVVCKLFNNIKDEYYYNFSWEKITQNSMVERYNSIIADLEVKMAQLQNQLETEKIKYEARTEILRKEISNKDNALEYERTLDKMAKTIDLQKDEILALKKQMESKEEYIRLLQNKEEDEVKDAVDVTVLQAKRFLFVGYINEVLPELRRRFPNSIFMDNESVSISNIKVDAVVMMIKYMSHGMYYKVCSSKVSKEVPIIHCNTKNINTVYSKMLEIL